MRVKIHVHDHATDETTIAGELEMVESHSRQGLALQDVRSAIAPHMRGRSFTLQLVMTEGGDCELKTITDTKTGSLVIPSTAGRGQINLAQVQPALQRLAAATVGAAPPAPPERREAILRVKCPGAPDVATTVAYFSAGGGPLTPASESAIEGGPLTPASESAIEGVLRARLADRGFRLAIGRRTEADTQGVRVRVELLLPSGDPSDRIAILDLEGPTNIAGLEPALHAVCDALTAPATMPA